MGDMEGNSIPDLNVIQLREDVYEQLYKGNCRARFTLAHEFGHLLLHHGLNPEFARTKGDHQSFEDSEWQANYFAGSFLMPRDGCRGLMPTEIARKYLVSDIAAEIRKKNIP